MRNDEQRSEKEQMVKLPPQLTRLHDLAYNLHWAWSSETSELFRRLDPQRWEESNHNPIMTLAGLDQERLQTLADDPTYVTDLAHAAASLDT